MTWPRNLNIALKEWASVCKALEEGTQIMLLRKGGIYESGGVFELEHREFLLFPTHLHQNRVMVKPEFQEQIQPMSSEPEKIVISSAGAVTDILEVPDRAKVDALDAEHIWAKPLIDMRFNYRPANPLYVLLVRAYRLHEPITLENTPEYAGCKSWVPLVHEVLTSNAMPVLDDVRFDHRRAKILSHWV